MEKTMTAKGQTVEEAVKSLKTITGHGIVFTSYEMRGVTPDGNIVTIKYDVKADSRFK